MNPLTKHYQPEVQVLRAIAVLAVLFFHLSIPGVHGGFVGVDMFFVISGYLITKNIMRDMQAGVFSLKTFYITRIYRLFPALLVAVLVTLIASLFILTPEHLLSLGEASIASILSFSNILFWLESGYFDQAKNFKPLLHTWSLGVEEQFYLLWPLLLVFLFPKGRKYSGVCIVLLFFVSYLAAELLLYNHRDLVFYWMPFRVGEFTIGAILVFINRPSDNSWWASLLSILGLVLIMLAITLYDSDTVFPGLFTLAPCLGTALLIHFGRSSVIYPFLQNPLLCKIGNISYSLYLVHWPVIVLVSYWKLGGIGIKSLAVVIPLIFVLAWILHLQVEQRFRLSKTDDKPFKIPYGIFRFAIGVMILSASISIGEGWSWRYDSSAKIVVESVSGLSYMNESKTALIKENQTLFRTADDVDQNYIIGDSFAEDTLLALNFLNPSANLKLLKIQARCQPVLPGDYSQEDKLNRLCNEQREKVYSHSNLDKATKIYLAASWREPAFSNLGSTLEYLKKNTSAKIVVFGPRAHFHNVPTLAMRYGKEEGLNEFVDNFKSASININNELLKSIADKANVSFVDLYKLLCSDGICQIISPTDKKIIYSDNAHLTISGAKYLSQRMSGVIE